MPSALGAALALIGTQVYAAPEGGEVVRGAAAISQQGKLTDIHQTTPKAAINWQKFGIKADEAVRFRQPDAQSVTLNRVVGNERSLIDGSLTANGKVFIQNPNGMLIGNGAKINVGGLVATTANISDHDFMNGFHRFQGGKGEISHSGSITVPTGGTVALIAPIVKNQGRITAPQGNALLASAEAFTLKFDGDGFSYTLDKGTLQGLVDNGGAVMADGGRIVLTAQGTDAVKQSLIKHSGIAQAHTVQNKNGVIELLGDLDNTRLEVSGSLKAEAKESGDGGLIETSAAKVNIADSAAVSTRAEHGKTGNWLIDPTDFTVSAGSRARDGSGIGASTLESSLNSNNVQLSTAAGGSGAGDIHINAPVSWNKNSLTLTAHNNININADLNGSGSAKLGLEYGQATADGGQSDYHLKKGVKVNLPAGDSFSLKKGSASETETFTVFHQMPEITRNNNGQYTSGFTEKNIAIGKDMDLSYTQSKQDAADKKNSFAGWTLPKGAKVHGLGHTLSNLKIDAEAKNVGLFQELNGGEIRNIGVKDADVSASSSSSYSIAGGLVGSTDWGTNIISHSYVHANVSASSFSSYTAYSSIAGGLVGSAGWGTNIISHSYANANVSATATTAGAVAAAGGLVGDAGNTTISHSYAHANVFSSGPSDSFAGGLVGSAWGMDISHSYAHANVSSSSTFSSRAGGLVGHAGNTTISYSYAHANVSSSVPSTYNSFAGGLVGRADNATISYSYAHTNVSSFSYSGGLVGRADNATISHSYAHANVSSSYSNAGGLVGRADNATISHSYALSDRITAGKGSSYIGGLIGYMKDGSILSRSYYDISRSAVANAVGSLKDDNGKVTSTVSDVSGQSTAQMQKPSTYQGWDFDKVWRITEGSDYPRLRALTEGTITITPTPPAANKTDIGIQAHNLKKVYDGKTVNTEEDLRAIAKANGHNDIVSVSGLKDGDTLSSLGSLTYGGTWRGAKNSGNYTIVPGGLNGGQKYEVKYGEGSLLINKKDLTITAMNNIKPEGENNPDTSRIGVVVKGLVKGESISDVKLNYSDNKKWQGEVAIIQVGEPTFSVGEASNYNIIKQNGKLLTVQKDYDLKDDKLKDNALVERTSISLNNVQDEMLLATAVYKHDGNFREVYAVIDKETNEVVDKILYAEGKVPPETLNFKYEKLYKLIDKIDKNNKQFANGLGVGLYERKFNDGRYKYYLVFRGTDEGVAINPLNADGGANVAQQLGLFVPEQYREASIIAKNLVKDNGNIDLTIVGHSLGGGLATYAAGTIGNNVPAITFNTAALGIASLIDINKSYKGKVPPFSHFVFDNDILNSKDIVGTVYKVDLLPNRQNSNWFDSKISDYYDNRVADHSMSHVIKTQRLANLMSKNNKLLDNCYQSSNCLMINENFYTLSPNSKEKDPFFALSVEKEKPVKVIHHNDTFRYGDRKELFKFFDVAVVVYSGFQINYPTQRIYQDGSVKLSMPIYNTLDTTLEIQVLDKNGIVVDTKFADPKNLTSNVVDFYQEKIEDIGRRGIESNDVSRLTDVEVTVPAGGSVKFTYNTMQAKLHNFIDPISDLIVSLMEINNDSMAAKEMAKMIVAQMVKDGEGELLKEVMKRGINLTTPQGRENMKEMLGVLGNSLQKAISTGKAINTSIDMMAVVDKLLGGSNIISTAKEGTEKAVTLLNFVSAGSNLLTDFSRYDVITDQNSK